MGKGKDRKGSSKMLTGSSAYHDYLEAAHLPWDKIEEFVGAQFSDAARQAIFLARQDYVESLDAHRSAPTVRQVDDLQKNILSHCRELHRIAVVVDQLNEPGTEESTMERAFDGLVTRYIESDFRRRFRLLSERCLEIEGILMTAERGDAQRKVIDCMVLAEAIQEIETAESIESSYFAVVTRSSPAHVMAFDDLYEKLAQAEAILGFTAHQSSPRFVQLVSWIAKSVGEVADAETVKGARRRRRNTISAKGGK